MAERRMFSLKIVDSDAFLDLPLSAQALYFHLGMRADDDGFVNNSKRIQRMVGANEDDLKMLIAKRFVLVFHSGVIVIKHWRMNNLLRKDRHTPTQYQDELATLEIKSNGAYTECAPEPLQIAASDDMTTTGQPSGNQMATQYSIGKGSIGKGSVVECSVEDGTHTPTNQSDTELYINLCSKYGKVFVDERMKRAKRYKGASIQTVAKWCEEDSKNKKQPKGNGFNNFSPREYDWDEVTRDLLTKSAETK